MKNSTNISGRLFIIAGIVALSGFLHAQEMAMPVQAAAPDSLVQIVADSQNLSLVSPGQAPRSATFWWIMPNGSAVPAPCAPPDLTAPIYQLAANQFLVDQTDGQIPASPRRFGMRAQTTSGTAISGLDMEADTVMNLIVQAQTTAANAQMGMMSRAMGMNSGPPGFGDTGDGGDDTNNFYSDSFNYQVPTNGLWLEITNVSNGYAWLNLHNATNLVYEILSKTDLTAAAWNIETALWPTDANSMPFVLSLNPHPSTFFVWARDWTDVTENGNTTPDWWFWKYFGTVALSDANQDANGNSLLSDYTNNVVPATFTFSGVQVANNYVNATPATMQLNVAGSPYYVAVLVDDTNFNDAVWNTYSSPTVAVDLWPQGWHEVWIGLRGHADAASAAIWQWKRLKLDYTPPQLVITGPTNSTVAVPLIQLAGYSPEALASISYDLSNAVAVVTNQPVFITGQNFSTNTWESTTNVFQGFDVPLTNGLNVITLHAMDLAGNMTTLATNIICTGNTNLPGVTLLWPQDGMQMSGDSFTIQGQVDDPTASVSVTAVDSSGNTNVINGRTGRDGVFWIENVPLSAGTTTLALTLSNTAGDTTTNFSVSQSSVGLSVDAVQAGDTTVNGSIDTDGYTVWVNGIQATDNGDGTWTAEITPIGVGGGLVQVTAVPDNTYSSNNNRAMAQIHSSQNNSPTPSVHTQATVQPPWGVYIVSSTYQDREDYLGNEQIEGGSSWADGAGGWLGGDSFDGSQTWDDSVSWPTSPWPMAVPSGTLWVTNNGQFYAYTHRSASLSFHYANEKVNEKDPVTGSSFSESAQGALEFATGGPLGSTARRLWQFSGSVTIHHSPQPPDNDEVPWSIPPDDETVADGRASLENLGNLGANGNVYAQLADNTRVLVTEQTKGADDYSTPPPSPVEVTLTGLTVVSNSATQIDATNWAAVKSSSTNDYVYIQATLSLNDTNAANLIQWSAGEKVPGNPFAVRVSKTNSVETTITATLGSTNMTVKVWIVWGTVTIQSTGTTPANAVQFAGMYDGTENLGGQIDGNDAVGKVVPIAQLTPTGVGAIVTSGWAFKREMWSHTFLDGVQGNIWNTNWAPDDSESWVHNLTPDDEGNIYDRDAPNIDHFYSPSHPVEYTCVEINKNFHQWIEWNGVRASDGIPGTDSFPESAKWHWKAKRQSSANPQPILKDASSGNITLPNSASGCP